MHERNVTSSCAYSGCDNTVRKGGPLDQGALCLPREYKSNSARGRSVAGLPENSTVWPSLVIISPLLLHLISLIPSIVNLYLVNSFVNCASLEGSESVRTFQVPNRVLVFMLKSVIVLSGLFLILIVSSVVSVIILFKTDGLLGHRVRSWCWGCQRCYQARQGWRVFSRAFN